MNDNEMLDSAEQQLRGFDLAVVRTASDDELCAIVRDAEAVARKLSAIQVAAAAEIADRSRYELGSGGLSSRNGFTKPAGFLASLARISGSEANRRMYLGSALRPNATLTGDVLPARFAALASAVDEGEVGPEAASTIVRALDGARRTARPDELDIAEIALVGHASSQPVEFVSDLARVLRDRLDPDGVRPREEEIRARRGIRLGRERNGVTPISGDLEPEAAALLKGAFDEANSPGASPRFLSAEDEREGTTESTAADGSIVVKIADQRTREQRQHDVFAGLIKAGVRNAADQPGQLRSTAEITATISVADLECGTGRGFINGIAEPVSGDSIKRMLCDAKFRRAVLGNDGELLALGKAVYPFTTAQRKAMVLRDGDRCALDGDTPAAWCDAHHVEEFYTHGALGETNVDNGVLLCGRCHDFIHTSEWQLKMFGGLPHVLAPPGVDPSQTWKRIGKPRVDLAGASQAGAAAAPQSDFMLAN